MTLTGEQKPSDCKHENETYDPAMHTIYCRDCGEETALGEEREQVGDGGFMTVWIREGGQIKVVTTEIKRTDRAAEKQAREWNQHCDWALE